MPQIPQYYRQATPTPTAGNDVISGADVFQAGAPYREIERAGHILTQTGLEAYQQIKQAQYANELNNAQVEAIVEFENYKRELATNPDTSTYIPKLRELQRKVLEGRKFNSKRAQDEFALWYKQRQAYQESDIQGIEIQRASRNIREETNNRLNIFGDLMVKADTEQTYTDLHQRLLNEYGLTFDENGRLADDPNYPNVLNEPLSLRKTAYERQIIEIGQKRDIYVTKQKTAAAEDWLDASVTATAAESGSWQDAINILSTPETAQVLRDGFGLTNEQIKTAISNVSARAAAQKNEEDIALEKKRESDRDILGRELDSDGLSYESFRDHVEDSSLDEKEQSQMKTDARNELKRRADAAKVTDDPAKLNAEVYTAIDERITRISLGAEDRKTLRKDILEARARGSITLDEQKTLLNKVNAEHSNYIDTIISRNKSYLKTQILTPNMLGELVGDAAQNEALRQAYQDYDAAIEATVKAGKEVTDEQMNLFGDKIAAMYRTSPSEITKPIGSKEAKALRDRARRDFEQQMAEIRKPDTVTVNGKTYKIGDTAEIKGATYRYVGNDQWEKVE